MEISKKDDKIYTFGEAIELAGNGCYTISLAATLSLSMLAMCLDMFGFSVVVTLCSCSFQLTLGQKSLLVSIPFIGAVIMAYAWGYICDTRGRRWSLLLAMSIAFLSSTLTAFSPHWIILAVLKLVSTCCSSCAHSASYTLLGESCSERVKGTYLLIMTSIIHMAAAIYFTLGYFIANLDFSYDLGYINILPWRLLALALALPLGLSAMFLYFFYESPKFLLNSGREDECVEHLRRIYHRNGGNREEYPVKKVILDEEGNLTKKDIPLLQSMWEQTAPLFKPPLLWKTLLFYYLTFTVYSSNSGMYIWVPFFAEAFSAGVNSSSAIGQEEGFCNLIAMTTRPSSDASTCKTSIDAPVVIAAVTYGLCTSSLNVIISKVASRKKAIIFSILVFTCVTCFCTVTIPSNMASFLYFATVTNSLSYGTISSYYVDLYPTSFRGMASCLGVMVARLSGVIGINLVGPFIVTSCTGTMYTLAGLLLSGVIMSCFLPPDKPKKVQ